MLYIIQPDDPSVYFMNSVIQSLNKYIEDKTVCIIPCTANQQSYTEAYDIIENIPEHSRIVFIGHSTANTLYGGHSSDFIRAPLLKLEQMPILKNIELFFVSCYSKELLNSSRERRNYSRCLGFGLLPSELQELDSHRGMRDLNLNQNDIDIFKVHLAEIISKTITYMISNSATLEQTYNYFRNIANNKTNTLIINDKNEKIATLFFYVVTESQLD